MPSPLQAVNVSTWGSASRLIPFASLLPPIPPPFPPPTRHKMAPRKKRERFREWFSGFFTAKDEVSFSLDGPQRHSGTGNFFNNAEGFVINDPIMTSIQGDNNTVINMQGTVTEVMSVLSQHIIRGAAHDDSARDPPPRCHPDTRVKLISRITAWFDGKAQEELLLWITGPAGVGKSAVVQTFAEYLVKSQSLGASVFISRPNKRNRPLGIFITIAFQLATRIVDYRKFIVERLSLDPSLLDKGSGVQFATFIVEPFIEKKIGAGGKRWGILLDGLDELEGEDAQCEIIQLISAFAHEHRDSPLVWIIASRPESHISNTFEDEEVRRSCWTEYIPIDSTEACADVERFLRSSFKSTQKKFRHSVHGDWPSDTDFLKLTAAASGLFVYAQVVMRFIGDPNHGDPISRLQVLLSVIERSNILPTKENPFVHLDALYNEILSSIPLALWPTAKQILGVTVLVRGTLFSPHDGRIVDRLRGIGLLFGIPRHVIYACLSKCRSTLEIPDWKVAHKRTLTIFHASFADYLKDPSRSGEFYVGDQNGASEAVLSGYFKIWDKCSGEDIAVASVRSAWREYCSQLYGKPPSRAVEKFDAKIFRGTVDIVVRRMVPEIHDTPAESLRYLQLYKVHMIKLCYHLDATDLVDFVVRLKNYEAQLKDKKRSRGLLLQDLDLNHLNWQGMSPASVRTGTSDRKKDWILHRPRSRAQLKAFVAELESLREFSPQLRVLIIGGIPNGRVAAFCGNLDNAPGSFKGYSYWIIPYPE